MTDFFQDPDVTFIATIFLDPRNTAKAAECGKPRFFPTHPASDVLSISLSRWKRTSSSSSVSILGLNKSARNRSLSLLSMVISSHSGRFQNQFYCPEKASTSRFQPLLLPAGGGKVVIFRLPVVLRRAHL